MEQGAKAWIRARKPIADHASVSIDGLTVLIREEGYREVKMAAVSEWEAAVPGAAEVQVSIDEYAEPLAYVGSVVDARTSATSYEPNLPPTPADRLYLVRLTACHSEGKSVGLLMVKYDRGYGWDYRFQVK